MRLAAIALLAASACFAAAPNLTGNWKMNASKSSFGEMPGPTSMTQKVTHAEPNLAVDMKMSSQMGDMDMSSKYTTDGKESTNQGFGGSETKSTAKWDGETLVIDTKGSFGDNTYTMKDKWTISADGKTLTVNRTFSSSMGEMTQKIIFDKE